MGLENDGKLGSPNAVPDHAQGMPAWQAMAEAQERQCQRRKWQDAHPGEMGPDDWDQRSRDWADVERGENLMGAMTFEPGDAFVPRGRK